MISINGQEGEYILDMNESTEGHRELKIDSIINGVYYNWMIYYVSDENINLTSFSNDKLAIDIDLEAFKKEAFVVIRNLKKENIKIIIKPNIELSRDKEYTLKLGKHTISGNSITLNVISKESGNSEPWSVHNIGEPLDYDISITKTKVTITLLSKLNTSMVGLFEIRQDKSGKAIRIRLKYEDTNTVELDSYKKID